MQSTMAPMHGEYGATAEVQSSQRSGRKSIMFAICAASMLLAVAALAVDRSPEAQERLQLASHDRTTMLTAAAGKIAVAATKVVAAPKVVEKATHVAAASTDKKTPLEKAAHVVAKRVAAVAPAKALKPAAHTAAVKQQRLAVVATAKPTIAKGKMLDGEEAAPAEEAPAEEAPAEDAPAAADDAAPAEGDAPAAEDAPAPAPAAAEGASDEPEGVIKDDDVASDIGSLKPTGIMGVFFNEKIMITAVCVIAFLLLAICCFAKYGDCALT